jgi:PAS domain S-box-containing protein
MRFHRSNDSADSFADVLDALPLPAFVTDADGDVMLVSHGWVQSTGVRASDFYAGSFIGIVHPDDRDRAALLWEHAVTNGEAFQTSCRVRMSDDAYRRHLIRAVPRDDDQGALAGWIGVMLDLEDQHRLDEAREQFVRLVENSDDFIAIGDVRGEAIYVNDAGRRMLEMGSPVESHGTPFVDYFPEADRAYVQTEMLPTIARDGHWLGEFRLRNFRTGLAVPVWYNGFALTDDAGAVTGFATVSRDLRERKRVDFGLQALSETGVVLFRSLDSDKTLVNVAEAMTRSFATFCIVDMLDERGRFRSVAALHRDPALTPAVERVAASRGVRFSQHPVSRAVYHGESTLVPEYSFDWATHAGLMPPAAEDFALLAPRSMICVPLQTGGDGAVVGAISFVIDRADPRDGYTTADLRFGEAIATRAGLAFDHARAYERERRIAVTLQEASLPRILPQLENIRFHADYRPGHDEATIGGDWYDAFLLDDGRVAMTVGDVLGSGLGAAVTMGRVRQAMRAVATVAPEPNAMLAVADRTTRAESADMYATAIAGIFDPRTRLFTFASAGHPSPFLRAPDGTIVELELGGLLLGMRHHDETETASVVVTPGSALLFFTDGLSEATRDVSDGYRRIRAAFASSEVVNAMNPAQAMIEHVLGGRSATDDVAVLVAEIVS